MSYKANKLPYMNDVYAKEYKDRIPQSARTKGDMASYIQGQKVGNYISSTTKGIALGAFIGSAKKKGKE